MEAKAAHSHLYDCIIIGGGISGISFAHKLREHTNNILLLEKEHRLGGRMQTSASRLDPHFFSELGPHACYNSYTRLLSMVTDLHLEQHVRAAERCRYVVYANEKIDGVMSKVSIPPLIMRAPRVFFSSKRGKTVRSYFRPIVGSRNYDDLFSNMFRGVICQRADDYPAELFLKRRKTRLKQFPRKFTFERGFSSLPEEIVLIGGINHLKDEEVTDVRCANSVYSISTRGGSRFLAKRVAFATPPHVSADLLREIEPEMARLLNTVPVIETASLNVVVRKEHVPMDKVSGIIPVRDDFFSCVSRDGVDHPHLRSFTFHYDPRSKDRDHIHALACKVLGVRQENVIETTHTAHMLPSLSLPHRDMSRQIDNVRLNESVYVLGNYFYGLSLEDCVHRSFDECARLLFAIETDIHLGR